ncbi:MAG: ABC transporter substrate binding protein [Stellaceae bacterium]
MKRRTFLATILVTACRPRVIVAQGRAKVYRIGWLTAQQPSSLVPYVKAFRAGLAEFSYVEGHNLVIDFRYGDDAIERVPELATQLVRLPVDLLVAQGAAALVISKLGLPVPIVYGFSGDPVLAGFADSLSRPRGNMTGVTLPGGRTHRKAPGATARDNSGTAPRSNRRPPRASRPAP